MHSGNWSDLADEYIFNQEFSSVSSSNKRERFKIDQNGDREMDFEFLTFGTWGFIIICSRLHDGAKEQYHFENVSKLLLCSKTSLCTLS